MEAMPDTKAARRGLAYLRKVQRPSGGFPLGGSGGVNSQSTAWVVQGLLAVGESPASIREGGNSPLDYLVARQAQNGHYAYSDSQDLTPIWVTGQALAATAEEAFPVLPAPREPSSASPAGSLPPVEPNTTLPDTAGGVPPSVEGQSTGGAGGSGAPAHEPSIAGGIPSPSGSAKGKSEGEGLESASTDTTSKPTTALSALDSPSTEPWAPWAIGLLTGGIALGSVLVLGRRYGW
jgi:hypothetical protein